jgi:hypothetical protein
MANLIRVVCIIKVAIQGLPRNTDEHDSLQQNGDAITSGDTYRKRIVIQQQKIE